MGKDAEKKIDPQQKQESEVPNNKKIIKKVQLKFKGKGDDDDDLKNWKPTKIIEKKEKEQKEADKKQKITLATSFLSSLPKPTNANSSKSSLETPLQFKPKLIPKLQLTEQQIKWDIEDKTYLKNDYRILQKQEQPIEQLRQVQQEQEIVDTIEWLNEDEQTKKLRQIDLTKKIEKDWNKEQNGRAQMQSDIWSSGLLQGRGQLSQFAKEAIQNFDEEEQNLNKRFQNKRKMKSRYGW